MQVKPIGEREYRERAAAPTHSIPRISTEDQDASAEDITINKTDQEVFVTSATNDPDFSRHLLPSRGFFYRGKKDITVRAFKVGDLKKLQHFLQTNNISHLIDSIQNCVTSETDVRELTYGDFLFLVFKIVFASHPNPDYKFKWTSFYANDNECTITTASLDILQLDVEKLLENFPEYRNYKFTPCLVKSYEVLHNNSYNPEDDSTWDYEKTWLYDEVAKYLEGNTPEEQLTRAESMSLKSDEYTRLKQFKTLIEHSVKNSIKVKDTEFKAPKALKILKERLKMLIKLSKQEGAEEAYKELIANNALLNPELLKQEINRIETALSNSQEVEALEETVTFRYNLHELIGPLFN